MKTLTLMHFLPDAGKRDVGLAAPLLGGLPPGPAPEGLPAGDGWLDEPID